MTTEEQKKWVKEQMHGMDVVNNGSKGLKEEIVHKYSNKGKGQLREAIIMDGEPYFLKYSEEKGLLYVEPYIDEKTRRLRPPHLEECPYEPYEFSAKSLNSYYLPLAKKETINSLYEKIKHKVKLFNYVDNFVLNLMSMNIISSCFQDRLSTVHYLLIVGGNGTGKSVFGDTFECLGYRPVNITNATEAFWYRVLGSVEYGQVTIIAEEIDKLDESIPIMNMLKTGYQPNAKVPRMNNDNDKMDFFFPFCIKILIAERSPNENKARGVLDRTFKINSYKGYPQFKIKEIRNPQGNKIRQKLLDELIELRKILLIFKLIHHNDPLVEVDVGLDGRDEEVCKPYLQLFYSLGASKETQEELEQTLYHFLNVKNKRKQNSKEALIYPIVKDLISKHGLRIDPGVIWDEIIDSFDGQIDDKNKNILHTADDGDFYRPTIIGMITDKFGGELDHKRKGNLIQFNKDIFERMGKQYDDTKGIQTRAFNDGDSCDPRDSPPRTNPVDKIGGNDSSLENLTHGDNEGVHQYESHESPESQDQPKKKCPYCDHTDDPFFLKVHLKYTHPEQQNGI